MKTLRLSFLPLLLVALVVVAPSAFAEEGPPPFGASDLIIEDEGLAEGWEVSYEDIEGTPGEELAEWTMQVARGVGLDEDAVYADTRILKGPEGTSATVVVVEVDGDVKDFGKALETRGKAQGYNVRALGHPSRLLVVAAPDAVREQIVKMQLAYSVAILSRLGFERLLAGSHVGAVSFGLGGRAIDPKAGPPLVLLGMVATQAEQFDDAIEAFRVGFADTASVKPEGRFAMRGYAHYGYACLQKESAGYDKEGRDALKNCVAYEKDADPKDPVFVQRYNLACAHSRLNEKTPALEQLEMALMMIKKREGDAAAGGFVKNRVISDPDWKNLKDDAGFKALVDKFTGGSGSAPEGL